MTEVPKRIPLRGGTEMDVFTGWRRMLCYTQRAGVCKDAKRTYSRRLRSIAKRILRHGTDDA